MFIALITHTNTHAKNCTLIDYALYILVKSNNFWQYYFTRNIKKASIVKRVLFKHDFSIITRLHIHKLGHKTRSEPNYQSGYLTFSGFLQLIFLFHFLRLKSFAFSNPYPSWIDKKLTNLIRNTWQTFYHLNIENLNFGLKFLSTLRPFF